MVEEAKYISESQEKKQFEKEDNRLPYEPPKLRKHGKVNDTTLTAPIFIPPVDSTFPFTDIS